MSTHIEAEFTFDRWDSQPVVEEPNAQISRTSMAKAFTGDLVGTSVGELVMAVAGEGSMAYSGFERVDGAMGDLSGSFVLRHNAFGTSTGGTMELEIMEGSGTGDLAGISGTASITRHDDGSHTFFLDYDLPTS